MNQASISLVVLDNFSKVSTTKGTQYLLENILTISDQPEQSPTFNGILNIDCIDSYIRNNIVSIKGESKSHDKVKSCFRDISARQHRNFNVSVSSPHNY